MSLSVNDHGKTVKVTATFSVTLGQNLKIMNIDLVLL